MTTQYQKPTPEINDENRAFWEGCRQGELRVQKCSNCGHIRHLSPACPQCLKAEHEWVAASGRGTVYSWIVVHQRYNRAFEEDLPYNVTIVELDEGPRMVTSLVDVENQDIKAGTPVEVVFDRVTEEITLPKFKRIG
ncbi:MAG TPA: hypothetical protein DDY93_14105 [Dehalococcoidia bacterium]|nr:MAG: hypothetical protein COB86_06090 [Dehalococcoidia bacterium]HAC17639.1 hypothetical protein [Dehalococcoidia bacterium]HBD83780.1 hypothetical protein [Dehalococcoidia bacterium]HBJ32488.1 hypothetical protein [Dehalococcoidia bacterium]HCH08631.1 hypothetical protein [Dehalococcoidia bacterium]